MSDAEKIAALERENLLLRETILSLRQALDACSHQTRVIYWPQPIQIPSAPSPLPSGPIFHRPFEPLCLASFGNKESLYWPTVPTFGSS